MNEIKPWITQGDTYVCPDCGHLNSSTFFEDLRPFKPYFCANCGICHDAAGLWERKRAEKKTIGSAEPK